MHYYCLLPACKSSAQAIDCVVTAQAYKLDPPFTTIMMHHPFLKIKIKQCTNSFKLLKLYNFFTVCHIARGYLFKSLKPHKASPTLQ